MADLEWWWGARPLQTEGPRLDPEGWTHVNTSGFCPFCSVSSQRQALGGTRLGPHPAVTSMVTQRHAAQATKAEQNEKEHGASQRPSGPAGQAAGFPPACRGEAPGWGWPGAGHRPAAGGQGGGLVGIPVLRHSHRAGPPCSGPG